jgi:glycosyltransferase involved in cell wall biosynthesis
VEVSVRQTTDSHLIDLATEAGIEHANRLRKQELIFAILKEHAKTGENIFGDGCLEVMQEGYGFLRSPESSYLASSDDIYVSPSQMRRYNLRAGDTVEGEIRMPREGERYFAWIQRVMDANHFSYEVIFVNDGSTDHSWQVIEKLRSESDNVKGIKFRRNYGKSPALYCGFEKAQGDVVITMDADLQDSPDEIPELYRMITEDGYDLVSGYKQKRYDPLSKTIPTKLFNATARAVSGIKNLHDFNCGLKAYRRDVVKNIEVYGEMHRYIPYLAKNAGFPKIAEKVVHHQARKFGKTKFGGLNRFFNGYLDLITLWFLSKFGIKPMHFFGFMGSLMFILGFISVIIIGANKLYALSHGLPYILITDSPYFYLALTLMILGTQLFLAGFIGELIARNAPEQGSS